MDDLAITVLIPTYNEAGNVAPLLEGIEDVLSHRRYEIIVIDGNSDDGTIAAIQAYDGEDSIDILQQDRRRGIGSAYKDGIPRADGDILVQMDADLSHSPTDLPDLIAAVEGGADVAVGSRYVPGGKRQDSFHRRIFPLIGSYLYRVLLHSPVRDVTSGFKAYRRSCAEKLVDENLPDGFHFQAASLFHLLDRGAEVEEVPITFRPRRSGTPKYSYPGDLLQNIALLGRLSLDRMASR